MFTVTPAGFFLFGAIMLASATIGLCFFKYYWRTNDRLLLFFAIAFWLMALERVFLILMPLEYETRSYVYILRLIAFLLIIYGIIDKNRAAKKD